MILILGGTGFVGGNIVKRLQGEAVRCLVRKKSYERQLEPYKVQIVYGNMGDKKSLLEATRGVQHVIHCVGILQEFGCVTHEKLVVEGTRNLIEACVQNKVEHIVYLSGLGTRDNANSKYHQGKWKAEQIILKSGLRYTIFRPSVIFGKEDAFLNMFADMVRKAPFMPIIGDGKYKLQPVSIHNLVECVSQAIKEPEKQNQIYEMGGPEVLEFNEIINLLLKAMGKKRAKIHMPLALMKPVVKIMESVLPKSPLTSDQLMMLQMDNVTDNRLIKQNFQINWIALKEGIKEYAFYRS